MLRVRDYIINLREVIYIKYIREDEELYIHMKDDFIRVTDFKEEEFEDKFKLDD